MDIFAHDEADGAALYGLSGSETKTFYGKFAFEITCCFRGEITLAPGAMREIVLSLFLLFAGLSAVASSQVQALLLPESAAGTPQVRRTSSKHLQACWAKVRSMRVAIRLPRGRVSPPQAQSTRRCTFR